MADYTYMGIANEVLQSLNEVTFDSETEFNNAVGFHQFVKDAINRTISSIYTMGDNEWNFQATKTTQVLSIGDNTYNFPTAASKVDWGSFYIDRVYADEAALTSVTADSATKTFTAAGGSFIDEGFEVGMQVRWSNLTANTTSDFTINTLTATVMTVDESVIDIVTPDTDFSVENAYTFRNSKRLRTIDIDHYRQNYLSAARNAKLTSDYMVPDFIVRESDNNFIVGPSKPNQTYLVRYEYFTKFSPMSAYDDVPTLPERHRHVIVNGTMVEANMFRDNPELAQIYRQNFDRSIGEMKMELTPIPTSLRYLQ